MMLSIPSLAVARLQNGLTALAAPVSGRRRAVLTLYFPTGSRFEALESSGISHFLEHMLFRGTPAHPSSESLAAAFEDLGGTLEASTSASYGNLSITVPRENLLAVIEPLSEVFRTPLLSRIDVERGIIREEVLEDFDDAGQLIDGPSLVRALAFPEHGLGRPITGPPAFVESVTEEQLRQHHARTYVANRLVVGVTGDVDTHAVLAEIERRFGTVPAGEALVSPAPDVQTRPAFSLVRSRGSSQTSVHLAFRTPGHFDRLDPAFEMLLRVIDDGMSTRLYQSLCDQSGLCYDAAASYSAHEDVGLIEFEADTAHDSTLRVVEELSRLLADLATGLVPEAELDRAKRRARWQYEGVGDQLHGLADHLALTALEGTAPLSEHLERLLEIQPRDLLLAAQAAFRPSQRSLVIVGTPPRRLVDRLEALALG